MRRVGAGGGARDAALARAGARRDRRCRSRRRGPLLACGAELKSTFCLARARRAWVGHHIGDLGNWETLRSFREGVAHFERLFAVEPELVVHDLHPDYLSTRYALEREGVETLAVPHHHAHLAACLAEHGWRGLAVGAIYDGAGLGPDGTVWGGEILVGDLRRVAAARPPAARAPARRRRRRREPWRMACAWLQEAAGADAGPSGRAGRPRGPGDLGRRRAPGPLRALAGHQQRRPPLRRRRRDLRPARPRRATRARRRSSSRPRADPAERGEYPMGRTSTRGRRCSRRRRTSRARAARRRRRAPASTTASRRRPRRRCARRAGAARARRGRAVGRRVPEPAAAGA